MKVSKAVALLISRVMTVGALPLNKGKQILQVQMQLILDCR
jgi:hypothetical protein